MNPTDFGFLADLLKKRSGLVLSEEKTYLVESRLVPLTRDKGLAGLDEMVAKLRAGDEVLAKAVTEAMTTNESFFFRDTKPFELFTDTMLPYLSDSRKTERRLRIWCAAASSGQEPYSLAMLLTENQAKVPSWSIDIVGTDICTKVLDKAKRGHYSQFEVQRGLPIQLLVKYFAQDGDVWEISQKIRDMVDYRHFNLLDDFRALGRFDIVYCRNVLIYFDADTKKQILERIAEQMAPDAFLLLGAAETVVGITDAFRPHAEARGLYVRADSPLLSAAKPAAVA